MQQVIHSLDEVIFNLKLEKLQDTKFFNILSKKVHMNPKQITRGIVAGIGLLVSFLLLFFAKNSVYGFLSVVYPAYMTAKTISNEDVFSKDGKLYLSYWIWFALLSIFNIPFAFIIRLIPFSYFVQCAFTIWLYNRKTRGAEFLMKIALKPIFGSLGGTEDKQADQGKDTMRRHSIHECAKQIR